MATVTGVSSAEVLATLAAGEVAKLSITIDGT